MSCGDWVRLGAIAYGGALPIANNSKFFPKAKSLYFQQSFIYTWFCIFAYIYRRDNGLIL
ncbi:hypothetical protein [Nodularia chucula]|uniref:hypothetical protein n=1 Tax=Nodularia chucula TaxID=3093667 RepID=UPI0039C62984